MQQEFEFPEYSRSVAQSMFADRVLLAVWRVGRTGQVSGTDRSLLEKADAFLRDAADVRDLTFAGRSSDTWPAAVRDMEHVIDALPLPVGSGQEFAEYMSRLRRTIEAILKDAKPAEHEVELVERFFCRYSELHHQRSRALTEF
jgi:hypothetical protein